MCLSVFQIQVRIDNNCISGSVLCVCGLSVAYRGEIVTIDRSNQVSASNDRHTVIRRSGEDNGDIQVWEGRKGKLYVVSIYIFLKNIFTIEFS